MRISRSSYWTRIWTGITIGIILLGCQKESVQPTQSSTLRDLSREEQELVRSINSFTFKLIQQAAQQPSRDNVLLSPLSINMAMSLMANGAAGSTQEQLLKALNFDVLSPLEVNKAYSELIPFLEELDPRVNLVLANAVWHDLRLAMSPFYRDVLQAYYKAPTVDINFRSRRSPVIIQKWVEDQIHAKAPQIPATLSSSTALYLTSTVQFTGKWAVPFQKEYTRPAEFYLPNGNSITTEMMYADRAEYRYYQTEQASFVDVPYGNKQYSMLFVMPHAEDSLPQLTATLNSEALQSVINLADTLEQGLYLPKFSIDYQASLKNTLSQLGMAVAFRDSADFSQFFAEASNQPRIQDVYHQASIDVNETGAHAVSITSNQPLEDSTSSVRIDRSFLFFIREQSSGLVLFAGILTNPELL